MGQSGRIVRCDPTDAVTGLILQEDTMLGFLMVFALQIAASGPAVTDPVIVPAEFRDYFDAARKGKLSIPEECSNQPGGTDMFLWVGFITNDCLGILYKTPKSFGQKASPSKRFISFTQAQVRRSPEMQRPCVVNSRISPT